MGCSSGMETLVEQSQHYRQKFYPQCQFQQNLQPSPFSSLQRGQTLFVQERFFPALSHRSMTMQKHLNYIRAQEGWETFYHPKTGIKNDVVVAVIDAGVDIDHEDIRSMLWVNRDEIPNNNIDDDGNGFVDDVHGYNFADDNGNPRPAYFPRQECSKLSSHGTHVSGLIVADFNNGRGVAGVMGSKARLMSLNVFGKFGQGCSAPSHVSIADAILYAVDNGANIINISFGSAIGSQRPDVSIQRAIVYALDRGVVVIASAGNSKGQGKELKMQLEGASWPASYGAQYAGMITVGATSVNDNQKCRVSNYSSVFVEIGAPGCDWQESKNGIYSSLPGQQYGFLGGTSMAAPIVAGAAALAYGLIRDRSGRIPSPAEVEDVLLTGSRRQWHLVESFKDGRVVDLLALTDVINRRYPFYSDLSYNTMGFHSECG